jgi:biotin carboxyl carrier protein
VQYELEIGGRLRQVIVTRTGDGFAVSLDGRIQHVDAARIDGHSLSLLVDSLSPEPHGPRLSRDVSIVADPITGQHVVHVGSVPVLTSLNGRRRWGRKEEGGVAGSGPQRIVAPMPGKIVRVMVQAGDRVAVRQPVVVVEAMKMENELRATREGTVAEVHVREGMSVDSAALLVVIQ